MNYVVDSYENYKEENCLTTNNARKIEFVTTTCIFRKNRALAPHKRSAVPLGTDHCPVG